MNRPTAVEVTRAAGAGFKELTATPEGLAWLERRPDDGQRTTVVSWTPQDGALDRVPGDLDIGSGLHGYGGGVYAITGNHCYAVRSSDSQIVYIGSDGARPVPAGPGGGQYGDLVGGPGGRLLAVRESADPSAGDALVLLERGTTSVLLRDDFLAAPAPGPGGRLAWLRWSGDQMPWDATELHVAPWTGGTVGPSTRVAGGPAESVVEPSWGPDGALYFHSDRTGWWNLHRWDGDTVEAVAPMPVDCAAAPWEPGYHSYAFLPGGRIGLIQSHGSRETLVVRQPDGQTVPVPLPDTSIRPHLITHGRRLAMIASSVTAGPRVLSVDLDHPQSIDIVARHDHEPDVEVSTPDQMTVPAADGQPLRVLLYPPSGATGAWHAPLIVRPHPGPTDNMHERIDWRVQFFTARGYAVADVDYRGSTNYGRAFRQSLYGNWGDYDVADCRAVADHLIRTGRAVPRQIFISGESAGGYTALKAVSDPTTPFAAAVAALSIVDPHRWQRTAARFQRPHAARLAGPAGPVRAADIRRPVLLMHGSHDTIAPVADVVELADALGRLGTPHRLIVFDGAGHGFSDPGHAVDALDAELALYEQLRTP